MSYFYDYASFERAKQHWIANHPNATPAEYEAAMQRLARKFGV